MNQLGLLLMILMDIFILPREVVSALIEGVEEVIEDLRPWGIHLHSAGGETADLGDIVRTIAFDCTLSTRVKRCVTVYLSIYLIYTPSLACFVVSFSSSSSSLS